MINSKTKFMLISEKSFLYHGICSTCKSNFEFQEDFDEILTELHVVTVNNVSNQIMWEILLKIYYTLFFPLYVGQKS